MQLRTMKAASTRRGGALVTVIVLTSTVAILAGVALAITAASVNEVEHERKQIQALYAAEAGINSGLSQLNVSWRTGGPVTASLGDGETLAGVRNSTFWMTVTDNANDTFTIEATGRAGGQSRTVRVVARPGSVDPFSNAMYAGNLSRDPSYELRLNGNGGQADRIVGNLFTGGDLVIDEDASVAGVLRSSGTITGATGEVGYKGQLPQMLEIDYEQYNDFNVADLFTGAARIDDDAGGTAGQLPLSSPAHIFRMNPSDRVSDTSATEKDDYFLEDPYEIVRSDRNQDGSDAFAVSLPESANNSVFFIDGNLWIHNRRSYSLKIKNEGLDPTRVTFVVKGNVYFSDNFFYDDPDLDGVSFVALADENVNDSGNIYYGDPVFGTMAYAEAFMFAENNFYDKNLDAAGSSNIEIRGSMTAGNQIDIQRDYLNSNGQVAHTQLRLTFDDRQKSGLLDLPGIPVQADQASGFTIVSWQEVATPAQYVAPPVSTIQVAGETVIPVDPTQGWRARWAQEFSGWKEQTRSGMWNPKP